MTGERQRLFDMGVWETVPDKSVPLCISRIFIIEKADKIRIVFDMRRVNAYVRKAAARYEGLRHLMHMARQNDYMLSFDIKDGFYHVPIHPAFRRFFAFRLGDEVLQFAALSMGWTRSPWVFTKLMRVVVRALRARGVRVLPYVDDFLILQSTRWRALRARAIVTCMLQRLGLHRSPTKGVWEPTQRIDHLGMTIDTARGLFMVPPTRVAAIQHQARRLYGYAAASARRVPAKTVASFAGIALATSLAVPPARLMTRALYDALRSRPPAAPWSHRVRLSSQAMTDLRWWAALESRWNGRAIWVPPTTATLHTDASGSTGWGAVLNRQVPAYGFWRQHQRPHHITWKELLAVRLSLQAFLRMLARHAVQLWCDNIAVVRIVTTGVSRSPFLMQELRKLWAVCAEHDIRLKAEYVRSAINIADPWSRIVDKSDWKLNPTEFQRAARRWGMPTIDRFATANNAQVPRYNSRFPDPCAEAVDAFTQSWAQEHNWINPPWDLLPQVVRKLRATQDVCATIVAPRWAAQPWFHDLRDMASDSIMIAPRRDVFFPGHLGSAEPLGNPHWQVMVFHIRPARCD